MREYETDDYTPLTEQELDPLYYNPELDLNVVIVFISLASQLVLTA